MSVAIKSSQNYKFFFSFQIVLDTLGQAAVDCLHVLHGNEENHQVFIKDFPSGQEDMSPNIISMERVMSLHFFNDAMANSAEAALLFRADSLLQYN